MDDKRQTVFQESTEPWTCVEPINPNVYC